MTDAKTGVAETMASLRAERDRYRVAFNEAIKLLDHVINDFDDCLYDEWSGSFKDGYSEEYKQFQALKGDQDD